MYTAFQEFINTGAAIWQILRNSFALLALHWHFCEFAQKRIHFRYSLCDAVTCLHGRTFERLYTEIMKKNSYFCLLNQRVRCVSLVTWDARVIRRHAGVFIAVYFAMETMTAVITGMKTLQLVVSSVAVVHPVSRCNINSLLLLWLLLLLLLLFFVYYSTAGRVQSTAMSSQFCSSNWLVKSHILLLLPYTRSFGSSGSTILDPYALVWSMAHVTTV